jgi:hypothetical protein
VANLTPQFTDLLENPIIATLVKKYLTIFGK